VGSTVIERPGVLEGPVGNIEIQLEEQPPYAVVLHNDNINTFEWVIKVLSKVFGYGYWKCLKLAMRAHTSGQSVVWSGALEIAELRAEQIVSCGPDPARVEAGARPLRVTLEPMR
jgi:ATP-dependent Clp protease adaptor protein ClpS